MKVAIRYTEPKLVKGQKPLNIPKGSTLEKEWCKNLWYVNYSYNGKQYRITQGLNRIKDPREKAEKAEALLTSIKNDLANGYNPEQPDAFIEQLTKQTITLADAVDNYIADVKKHGRKKSVQSYYSKLRYLVEAYPTAQLKDITSKDIEKYIREKIRSTTPAKINMKGKVVELSKPIQWTASTVKAGRGYFRAFFNWCIREGYTTINPITGVELKKIRSEVEVKDRHIPFTKEDATAIMNYLDRNDKFTAFFCRMIYASCLRPKELSELRIKDIDLTNKKIKVPLSTMKNTKADKADLIDIEANLFTELQKLNPNQYPSNYYLTSNDTDNIIGVESAGTNKPYKRFVKALAILNLQGKGYTLYSFKHFSNIQRLNRGWTVTEIMKANRHSSISMTEGYLKNITRTTDISEKAVPAI